jgi:hypothetical protein
VSFSRGCRKRNAFLDVAYSPALQPKTSTPRLPGAQAPMRHSPCMSSPMHVHPPNHPNSAVKDETREKVAFLSTLQPSPASASAATQSPRRTHPLHILLIQFRLPSHSSSHYFLQLFNPSAPSQVPHNRTSPWVGSRPPTRTPHITGPRPRALDPHSLAPLQRARVPTTSVGLATAS